MVDVNVAFVTNRRFWNYTYVAIYSLLEHGNSFRNYRIYIISEDYDSKKEKQLKLIENKNKNVCFKHIDPSDLFDGYDFFVLGHFSKETYYRLAIHNLIPELDKVLYLDSDIIVNHDVSELYDVDLGKNLVGACLDPDTAGLYNGYQPDKKEYMDLVLKLKNPYLYFQAGVLLMNLSEFRRMYTAKEILDYSVSQKFQLLDQDVLNCLCEGSVKCVDMSWNVMVDFSGIRRSKIISRAPQNLIDMYDKARKSQKIIHYAGPEKPWHYPEMDMAGEFWSVARQTVVYESILWNMAQHAADEIYRYRILIDKKPIKKILETIRKATLHIIPSDNPLRAGMRNAIKKLVGIDRQEKRVCKIDWVPKIPDIYR